MSTKTTIFVVLAVLVAGVQTFELYFAFQGGRMDIAGFKALIVAACIGYVVHAFRARSAAHQGATRTE
ncbi:MAG: hypothetical protein KDJ14_14505 [Xanthomonadales bacterium]|nr:hypothetical protein [Xanthomonadales bacterium]